LERCRLSVGTAFLGAGLTVALWGTSIGFVPARAQETFQGVILQTEQASTPYYPAPIRPQPGSPNVLYVVLDDTGFSDLGSFGSEIATPTFDRLAQLGLRYNNFHTRAICSPSRAALLTGRNSHSVGVGNVAEVRNGFPNHRGEITHAAATIAEILRSAGYNTFAVGKWHLTPLPATAAAGPFDQWPIQRGFDRYYGFLEGYTDQYRPQLVQDNTRIHPPVRPGYFLTTDLVDHAIQDVRDQTAASPDKPFFLYLALGATHAPHQAPTDLIDKYVPVFSEGWDRVRDDRLAKQKALGIVSQDAELTPRNPGVPPWDQLNGDEKQVETRLQAAFAGYLEQADTEVGRLINFLSQIGRLDNTIIVVLSDNGATAEGGVEGAFNYVFQDSQIHPTNEAFPDQLRRLKEIGTDRTLGIYPMGWAMAGNTPFKYYKGTVWAGGEHTPLIISWPKGIKDAGAIRSQFVDIVDITPTILDIVGTVAPKTYAGVPQIPIAGSSIATTFDHADVPSPRRTQYFEIWGQRALWHDDWMAVAVHRPGADFTSDHWELYDLKKDFSEVHDVSGQFPNKVMALEDLFDVEARKYAVYPLDDRPPLDLVFNVAKGHPDPERLAYTFYPGQAHLPRDASPAIENRSFVIEAEVEMPQSGGDGVLLASGDRFGGYVLFVKERRLVFDFNDFGKHTVITASDSVPPGRHMLRYAFQRTGEFRGTGTLFVDGTRVGSGALVTTQAGVISWAGLDVGRDTMSPVSDAYVGEGDFAFPQGALMKVEVTLEPLSSDGDRK
jgi:arylsulfatase A-like enzyme